LIKRLRIVHFDTLNIIHALHKQAFSPWLGSISFPLTHNLYTILSHTNQFSNSWGHPKTKKVHKMLQYSLSQQREQNENQFFWFLATFLVSSTQKLDNDLDPSFTQTLPFY
jgi:predicted double-glycine peptidase